MSQGCAIVGAAVANARAMGFCAPYTNPLQCGRAWREWACTTPGRSLLWPQHGEVRVQMGLYYAPAVFFYVVGASFRRHSLGVV